MNQDNNNTRPGRPGTDPAVTAYRRSVDHEHRTARSLRRQQRAIHREVYAYGRILAATRTGARMLELGPWSGRETVAEIRAAADMGTALALWQDWPDPVPGISVGILADVPCATSLDPVAPIVPVAPEPGPDDETTVARWYIESLTRALVWAVAESAETDNATGSATGSGTGGDGGEFGDGEPLRHRVSVVLADGRADRSRRGGRVPLARVPVARAESAFRWSAPSWAGGGGVVDSLPDGIARLGAAARLTGSGTRLLVLITDTSHALDDEATTYRMLRRLVETRCAVLVIRLDSDGTTSTDGGDGTDGADHEASDYEASDYDGPVTGAVTLTVDPCCPIPAHSVALAAIDALTRVDPAARSHR